MGTDLCRPPTFYADGMIELGNNTIVPLRRKIPPPLDGIYISGASVL